MTDDLRPWLSAMTSAACAVGKGSGATFAAATLVGNYPRLLEKGLFPAPGAVVDLAHLFVAGPDARFDPPKGLSAVAGGGTRKYCEFLKGAVDRGGLHWTVDHARNLRTIDATAGAGDDIAGLACFLDTVLPLLPECGSSADALRVLKVWPDSLNADDLSSPVTNLEAQRQLSIFFARCDRDALDGYEDELGLLVISAAKIAHGEAAMNLPLLQACLQYAPCDAYNPTTRRRLQKSLNPREKQSSGSPEMGNHGITRKGPISAVLRSLLARDDFESRHFRHELLYFQRHAPKLEPRRVLVAFLVDCGTSMRTRPRSSKERRSSIALRIVAHVVEDIMRATFRTPALEIQPVVLLHNGKEGEAVRRRTLALTSKEIENLGKADDENKGWLPTWYHFLPTFFLNEPMWDCPIEKAVNGETAVAYCLRSLKALAASLCQAYSSSSNNFDLAFVVILGNKDSAVHTRDGVQGGSNNLLGLSPLLAPLAASKRMHFFRCGEEALDWTCFPPQGRPPAREFFGYTREGEDQVRILIRDDLTNRLLAL